MIKKNYVAKDLRSPKYKQRIVKDKSKYTRKTKHVLQINKDKV